MIRYKAAAVFLKIFSLSSSTRRLYRLLANRYGAKRRMEEGLTRDYVDRARLIIRLLRKYSVPKRGSKFLELGTGWLHWEAIVVRLLFHMEGTVFDVSDNRQLRPIKRYCAELADKFNHDIPLNLDEADRVQALLVAIASSSTFDELYSYLGFTYVLNPTGTLSNFDDETFQMVTSYSVLEHVDKDILAAYVQDVARLLKPGGYSIQTIDISDHLSYYDRSASRKNYLQYSDTVWKVLFENKVQYINRVQRPEWLSLFESAGLDLCEEESNYDDSIVRLPTNPAFTIFSRKDLECTSLRMIHRKPQTCPRRPVNDLSILR